jgi:rhodanese-related sulfurtransferase
MNAQISVEQLKHKLDNGEAVFLVDVRQPEEFAHCRLKESLLIPLPELHARFDEVRPPEGTLVVVYCHHGVRSMTAAAMLRQAGISAATSLTGGIDAWSRRIDPTVPRY